MATYSRTALVKDVADALGFNQNNVKEMLDVTLAKIAERTEAGDAVNLPGFGKFEMKERAARTGRNPGTGEAVQIPASRRLTFKASKPKS